MFIKDVSKLIRDLNTPDYITRRYAKEGINSLIVLKSVFKPDKSYLGNYLVKTLMTNKNLFINKDVLDMGCGCGLLGLICSINGASSVYFSDINPTAIKNTKINSILLDARKSYFSCSNLFKNISNTNKFDLIIFNPPVASGKPLNKVEMAFIRNDNLMSNFFKTFKKFLKPDGIIIMPWSTRFNKNNSPIAIAEKNHLKTIFIAKQKENDGNYIYAVSFET